MRQVKLKFTINVCARCMINSLQLTFPPIKMRFLNWHFVCHGRPDPLLITRSPANSRCQCQSVKSVTEEQFSIHGLYFNQSFKPKLLCYGKIALTKIDAPQERFAPKTSEEVWSKWIPPSLCKGAVTSSLYFLLVYHCHKHVPVAKWFFTS